MISKEQYELNERSAFLAQIKSCDTLPLSERNENKKEMIEVLQECLQSFYQAVSFLINGDFGYGAYQATKESLQNKRMNRKAWLFNTTACLNYSVPFRQACNLWHGLDFELKEKINKKLDEMIEESINEE